MTMCTRPVQIQPEKILTSRVEDGRKTLPQTGSKCYVVAAGRGETGKLIGKREISRVGGD